MNLICDLRKIALPLVLLISSLSQTSAQDLLDKHISLKVRHMPLRQVLEEISRKGGFYFSYKTNILNGDSLVDADARGRRIGQLLDQLLGEKYEYVESDKYIILLPKITPGPVKLYTITGYVEDADTRQRIRNASVYEGNQLVSKLTDTNGVFRLKLKTKDSRATIIVSKEGYRDTLLIVHAGYDQELTFVLAPVKISELPALVVSPHVERSWLGRLFLSARQKIQNRNLSRFTANKPGQISLIPGLSTRGRMSAQVVNRESINILGGYTAGTKILELGGVFNINKKDVSYFQAAGLFNEVGGNVKGLQVAGFYNHVYNNVHGVQLAGFANICRDTAAVQVAGFINIAKKVRGVQLSGFINIADSSDYPIGILNFIKNGERTIGISTDETLTTLLSFRSGGRKLYGILGLGYNGKTGRNLYAMEVGLGAHVPIAGHFRFDMELVSVSMTDHYRASFRALPALKLARHWELFAGPSFNYLSAANGKGADLVSHYTWSEKDNNNLHCLYFGAIGGLYFIF